MPGTENALAVFSDHAARIVEQACASVVAVAGGSRWSFSGIHWRPGIIVTAEERLDRDDDLDATLPGGRRVAATLVGRDPTTDVAVLRFDADGLATAASAEAAERPPRAGQVALAIGNHEGAPLAALGIVAFAGGPWQSMRGGAIDSLIRLDLRLGPAAEGGAVVDADGHLVGMAVLGPRRRALAIPAATVNRAVDQLLARGHVFRGYLGAGLQSVRRPWRERGEGAKAEKPSGGRGVLVVNLDPDGPSARAGLLVGDIITAWNGKPVERMREIVSLLGPESVGSTADLGLIRGGAPAAAKVVVGERPVR
jgi:S1-C subfamily serine protease